MVLHPEGLPADKLAKIAEEACESALANATSYDHALTQQWNEQIIGKVLQSCIAASTQSSEASTEPASPPYKFAVNSTIIQHLGAPAAAEGAETSDSAGRRGMHSAAGAYWNNERDGFWSYKFTGGEKKGMDVVVLVFWIGL